MPKYYVYLTVNSPRGETDYKLELDDLNLAMDQVYRLHPSATSVVMSVVPNDSSVKTLSELDPDRLREDRDDHMRDGL